MNLVFRFSDFGMLCIWIFQVIDLYHPLSLRLFLLGTHYRSPINYSDVQLESASERLFYIYQVHSQSGQSNIKSHLLVMSSIQVGGWIRNHETMDISVFQNVSQYCAFYLWYVYEVLLYLVTDIAWLRESSQPTWCDNSERFLVFFYGGWNWKISKSFCDFNVRWSPYSRRFCRTIWSVKNHERSPSYAQGIFSWT